MPPIQRPHFDDEQLSFIGGESVAWPTEGHQNYGDHWRHMHRAVKAIRETVRDSDDRLGAIEDNRDLADHGRARQLNDVGLGVLNRVDESPALQTARVHAEARIAKLDAEMTAHAKAPEEPADIALAGEIRAALRGMAPGERMRFIHENLQQPGFAGAVTSGAAFLSGLSATEQAEVRNMVSETLYAPQAAEKALIQRGLRELSVGIDRARKLVAGRAHLEPNVHGDWAPRGQRVPQPGSPTYPQANA